MSLTHNYRKIENRFFLKISAFFSTAFKRVRVRLNKLSRLLGRRYTVMVIPHTEKKAVNFKISFATAKVKFFCIYNIICYKYISLQSILRSFWTLFFKEMIFRYPFLIDCIFSFNAFYIEYFFDKSS